MTDIAPLRLSIYFDGTEKNKNNDQGELKHTNVARLYELDTAEGTDLSRNSLIPGTNKVYSQSKFQAQTRSQKLYFDGVGSQPGWKWKAERWFQGATGQGATARVNEAYDAIVAFHNANPGQEVQLNLVGFSRGASQARALANKFIGEGVKKLDAQGKPTGEYLIQPGKGEVNKLAIFDTVASYAPGAKSGLDLRVPAGVKSCTHCVAMHEFREPFSLTTAHDGGCDPSRIDEIKCAGNHAQIGGGYAKDILAAGPLALMHNALSDAGVELKSPETADLRRIDEYNEIRLSPDAVRDALKDSRRMENGLPFPGERPQFRNFAHEVTNGRKVLRGDDDLLLDKISSVKSAVVNKVTGWFDGSGDPSSSETEYEWGNPHTSEDDWQKLADDWLRGEFDKQGVSLDTDAPDIDDLDPIDAYIQARDELDDNKNPVEDLSNDMAYSRPNTWLDDLPEAPVNPVWGHREVPASQVDTDLTKPETRVFDVEETEAVEPDAPHVETPLPDRTDAEKEKSEGLAEQPSAQEQAMPAPEQEKSEQDAAAAQPAPEQLEQAPEQDQPQRNTSTEDPSAQEQPEQAPSQEQPEQDATAVKPVLAQPEQAPEQEQPEQYASAEQPSAQEPLEQAPSQEEPEQDAAAVKPAQEQTEQTPEAEAAAAEQAAGATVTQNSSDSPKSMEQMGGIENSSGRREAMGVESAAKKEQAEAKEDRAKNGAATQISGTSIDSERLKRREEIREEQKNRSVQSQQRLGRG
jgi:hypothetical protein